ncbi:MAG: alkaline phosphatase family protein, partial [Acidimicrobiales bacterium]
MSQFRFGRRRFLEGTFAGVASAALATHGVAAASQTTKLREAGSLPNPSIPPGTDLVPEIENFVVVMMENHSFDNILGMMGRGDCFARGHDGLPEIELPDGHGNLVRAFHMPSECQTDGVGNNWNLGHHSYDNGSNRGFVEASTGEALGYFLGEDLPFTWGMARTFPIADHWFCSLLGQTNPNRRFLFAGTSLGQVSDTYPLDLPPNGTIFDALNRYGITWKEYYSDLPSSGVWLPLLSEPSIQAHIEK